MKWSKYQKSPKDLFNIEIDAHQEADDALKGKIQNVQGMYASCDRCIGVSDRADPKHSGHLDKFKGIADLKDATGEARDQDKPRLFCRNQGIGPLDPARVKRCASMTRKKSLRVSAIIGDHMMKIFKYVLRMRGSL